MSGIASPSISGSEMGPLSLASVSLLVDADDCSDCESNSCPSMLSDGASRDVPSSAEVESSADSVSGDASSSIKFESSAS